MKLQELIKTEKKLQKMYLTFNSLLTHLVNNLCKVLHRIKGKYGNGNKCETCGIKCKYCDCFLNTQILKMI